MDYNFFEPVKQKPKRSGSLMMILTIVAAALLVIVLVFCAYQLYLRSSIQRQIDDLVEIMQSPEYQNIDGSVAQSRQEKADLEQSLIYVKQLDIDAKNSKLVREEVIRAMSDDVLIDMYLSEISVEKGVVTIRGRTMDFGAVAHFENTLRDNPLFENIVVTDIQELDFTLQYSEYKDESEGGAASTGEAEDNKVELKEYSFTINLSVVGSEPEQVEVPVEEEAEQVEDTASDYTNTDITAFDYAGKAGV